MKFEDFPFRDKNAQRLAERDAAALEEAEPQAFRLERTRLGLDTALRNGLSEREARRLGHLAGMPSTGRPRWLGPRSHWAAIRLPIAVAASVMTVAAVLMLWPAPAVNPPGTTLKMSASTEDHRYQLEDGSWLKLKRSAQGSLITTDSIVRFQLEHGVAEVNAAKVKDRRWLVVAEDYEVSAVGTHFTVSYEKERGLAVSVVRGTASVRVPGQPAAFQVIAGARLEATSNEVTLRHERQPGLTKSEGDVDAVDSVLDSTQSDARVQLPSNARADRKSAPHKTRSALAPNRSNNSVRSPRTARQEATDNAPKETKKFTELSLLSNARRAIVNGDYHRGMRWIKKHRQLFPKGHLVEEREALRVKVLHGLEREAEARKAADEFQERFPKSVLSPQMSKESP